MNQFITIKQPRLIISAHKGGAGKTIFTLILIALLKEKGFKVAPFKKGPDYIDAGWLGRIAHWPCRNLDLFLFDPFYNLYSFYHGSKNSDIAVIEGNRGLFDGVDIDGSCSTESLAKLLKSPILLVVDCTKSTRSLAALIKGFIDFDSDLQIKGIILNHVATPRQESIIRGAIEKYVGVPVVGLIPRLRDIIKERHLGLITSYEEDLELIEKLKEKVKDNIDVDMIIKFSKEAPLLSVPCNINENTEKLPVKIGVFNDPAFQFYYPENLEMLTYHGANLIFLDALKENKIPNDLDGLYLGGGFPEVYADILAENEALKRDVKTFVEEGMPVYAECGGLMYLGEEIEWQEKKFPMAGVLSIKFKISKKPFGHGYVIAKVIKDNPFYPQGDIIRGHEFHYSYPVEMKLKEGMGYVFQLEKGVGFNGKLDGIHYKNLLASYTHIHVFGVKYWALNFVKLAYSKKFQLNKPKEVQDV